MSWISSPPASASRTRPGLRGRRFVVWFVCVRAMLGMVAGANDAAAGTTRIAQLQQAGTDIATTPISTYDGTVQHEPATASGLLRATSGRVAGDRSDDRLSGDLARRAVVFVAADTAGADLGGLKAAVDATIPSGVSRAEWGAQVWGGGPNAAAAARGLMGRSAAELEKIPGLTIDTATLWRNFYQAAVDAGKGGTTAGPRVALMNDIIKTLGGG